MARKYVISGFCLIIIGICLGAFGAHGLAGKVSPEKIASFEVGVKYQLYHGFAFLILGSCLKQLHIDSKFVFYFLLIGVLLFSCSIYILVLQKIVNFQLGFIFGPMTPLGGLLLIIGWVLAFRDYMKFKRE